MFPLQDPCNLFDAHFCFTLPAPSFSPRASPRGIIFTTAHPPDAEWASDGSVGSRRSSDEFSEMSAMGMHKTQEDWSEVFRNHHLVVPKVYEDPSAQHVGLPPRNGAKLFYCREPGCTKTYTTTEGLRLHNRNIHMKDKRHKCTVDGCERAFVRASDLKLHILRIHEKERPFPCTEPNCSKSFACNSELTRHLNCHTRHRGSRKKMKSVEQVEL